MGDGLGGDVDTSAGSPSPPQSLQLRPGHCHPESRILVLLLLNMKSTGITIGQGQVIKLTIHFLIHE